MNRSDILKRDLHRKSARHALGHDGRTAISNLHPKALLSRWKSLQLSKITHASEQGREFVEEHPKLLIGAGAAAILLVAAYPIRKLLEHRRGNKEAIEDNIE